MTETFRKTWRGEVSSSEGYSVRISGRTGLRYRQGDVTLHLSSEVQAGPGTMVVLYPSSIPDDRGLDRSMILSNIQRAFLSAGWHLMVQG